MRTSTVIYRDHPHNRRVLRRENGAGREFAESIRRITSSGGDLARLDLVRNAFAGIESSLVKLIPKMQGFGSLLRQVVGDLVKMGTRSLLGSLTGAGGRGGGGGIPGLRGIPGLGGGGIPGLGVGGLGALGALFSNPWTAIIGGAITGGLLVAKLFSNRTEKKLRDAIQSSYGVTVRDMSVLRQIKEVGEQAFGRGQVSRRLMETIKLDQARELIMNYAEATGQQARGSEALLKDPAYAGNRFMRSETAGFGGAEPPKGGTQSAGSLTRGGTQSAGAPTVLVAGLVGAIERLSAQVERLKAMPPGQMVAIGAAANPVAIANAAADGLERSGPARQRFANKTGA